MDTDDGPARRRRETGSRPAGPTRPVSRPTSVWVLTGVIVFFASISLLAGYGAFADAVDHGDQDAVPYALARIAVAAALLVCTTGVFIGARWGRTGVATVCALNFLGVVLGALNGVTGGFALILALGVNLALGLWALGPTVDAWTGDGSDR